MFPHDLNVTIQEPKLQKLNHPLLESSDVQVDVVRFDKIHPVVSGNKFFKLRYFLQQAQRDRKGIITFGGPWSNHLHATAFACKLLNIGCTGIVRGERPAIMSATLTDCEVAGMRLLFVDRGSYRQGDVADQIAGDNIVIPEGGATETGVQGAATMLNYIDFRNYDELVCSVGTGTMMAGLMQQPEVFVRGFCALKLSAATDKTIEPWIRHHAVSDRFSIEYGYHFGGYAHHPESLLGFMHEFTVLTGVPTDLVYTAKMFYGLLNRIQARQVAPGTKICAIHSGGLQGNRSMTNFLLPG